VTLGLLDYLKPWQTDGDRFFAYMSIFTSDAQIQYQPTVVLARVYSYEGGWEELCVPGLNFESKYFEVKYTHIII